VSWSWRPGASPEERCESCHGTAHAVGGRTRHRRAETTPLRIPKSNNKLFISRLVFTAFVQSTGTPASKIIYFATFCCAIEHARCKAVNPSLVITSGSTCPSSMRYFTQSYLPFTAAQCNGVAPSRVVAVNDARADLCKYSTIDLWPFTQAKCNGVCPPFRYQKS